MITFDEKKTAIKDWTEWLRAALAEQHIDINIRPELARIVRGPKRDRVAESERAKSPLFRLPKLNKNTALSKEELQRLVWSEPMTKIAKCLGISDKAVAKRCKTLGVPVPPRGFWNQVFAGKRPHPRGEVQGAG